MGERRRAARHSLREPLRPEARTIGRNWNFIVINAADFPL
jgi:hypothetical protein